MPLWCSFSPVMHTHKRQQIWTTMTVKTVIYSCTMRHHLRQVLGETVLWYAVYCFAGSPLDARRVIVQTRNTMNGFVLKIRRLTSHIHCFLINFMCGLLVFYLTGSISDRSSARSQARPVCTLLLVDAILSAVPFIFQFDLQRRVRPKAPWLRLTTPKVFNPRHSF